MPARGPKRAHLKFIESIIIAFYQLSVLLFLFVTHKASAMQFANFNVSNCTMSAKSSKLGIPVYLTLSLFVAAMCYYY